MSHLLEAPRFLDFQIQITPLLCSFISMRRLAWTPEMQSKFRLSKGIYTYIIFSLLVIGVFCPPINLKTIGHLVRPRGHVSTLTGVPNVVIGGLITIVASLLTLCCYPSL
jgi:hypothetical protein